MLPIKRTIGPKGQIVLPMDIRKHFNLRTGADIVFTVQEHEIILKPALDSQQYVEDFCSIGKKLKKLTMKEMKKIIEEQYEAR